MAPLSPAEFVAGFALGGVTRGLLVGGVVALAMWPFVPFSLAHPAFAAFHALAACLLLALMGILGGLWAQKMDHLVLSALAPTDGIAAILLLPLPLERNKALNRALLRAAKIAGLRPLGAKSDRTRVAVVRLRAC